MTGDLIALPAGYRLQEYEFLRVLGTGGFGITYLAFDHNLDKPVAVKEYLPRDLATRTAGHTVAPQTVADKPNFDWGLERFVDEARMIATFDHPNVIKVHRYFQAHGTAYIVMEYAEGVTLAELLATKGTLNEASLKEILLPILAGLEVVHENGFLHRDIKPGNIVIRRNASPVLLDFGSARQAVGVKSRSVTSIVTPGYAPIEQYSTRGNQGPWTDIYALAAVCYRALTGEMPADATDRVRRDPLVPAATAAAAVAGAVFLRSVDWALAVDEDKRPQSIAAWRAALTGDVPILRSAVEAAALYVPLTSETRPIQPSTRAAPAPSPADLGRAITSGNTDAAIEMVGRAGRDAYRKNSGGYTPLMLAASAGNERFVQWSIATHPRWIEPEASNASGERAADLARRSGHANIATMLSTLLAAQTRELQAELQIAGMRPGPVDGVLGNRTLDALELLKRANGDFVGMSIAEIADELERRNGHGLYVCNRSDADALWVAVAYDGGVGDGNGRMRGWWKVDRDQCARPLASLFDIPTVYGYAESSNGLQWTGDGKTFCVVQTTMDYPLSAPSCDGAGKRTIAFLEWPVDGPRMIRSFEQ